MTDQSGTHVGVTASGTMPPGMQLRAARERAGWSTERLAAELCIPVARLRALEEDDHAGFGGVVFVRGYLRRAAVLLGLPQEELVRAFEACCDTRRPAEILPGPIVGRPPRRDAPGWLGPAAGVTVVVTAAVGSWWMMGQGHDELMVPERGAEPPVAGLEFTAPQELPVAPAPRVALAERPVAEGIPPETGDGTAASAATEPLATALLQEPVAAPPRVVEAPEPAPPPLGTAELRFEFTEDCWLEVMDADETRLAYRLYRAGDVARLRGKAPMMVFLGNAEGVRLTVNGSPIAVRPAARRDGTARLTVGGGAG